MKKYIIHLLSLVTLLFASSGINSNNNNIPSIDETTMTDIVTFVGNPVSNNSNAVFQFQEKNDSRMTTLLAKNIAIDTTTTKVNTRMLLYYTPESGMHNIDDLITVKNAYSVYNDSIRTGDISKIPNMEMNPIFVEILQRSGTYINIQCGLTYVIEPLQFMLMVDATTIDNEMPDVYLTYKKDNNKTATYKSFIASIDIANLWNRPSCKGITIHVNDSNFGNNKVEFKKTTLTPMN